MHFAVYALKSLALYSKFIGSNFPTVRRLEEFFYFILMIADLNAVHVRNLVLRPFSLKDSKERTLSIFNCKSFPYQRTLYKHWLVIYLYVLVIPDNILGIINTGKGTSKFHAPPKKL